MGAQAKVLTVSYGAFSCTLKGFDEPFEVVRAVTEMLEEIASRTPGFGLLPVSPDSPALAEIARATDAKVEAVDGTAVLRPAEDGEPQTPLDAKLDRIRSALMGEERGPAPDPAPEFVADTLSPEPLTPPAPVAESVQTREDPLPQVFPAPMVEDPSEQVLLDAKEELARELAKIEAEIIEERAKQARLQAEAEALVAPEDVPGTADADDVLEPEAPVPTPAPVATLEPDADDDALKELAEDDEEDRLDPIAAPAAAVQLEAPDPRPQLGDTSVTRILEQTNWEMDKPEGNRRRSAIAHLRAAVAATRADRILGQGANGPGAQAAYREDLEDAVRPHGLSGGDLAEARTGTDDALDPLALEPLGHVEPVAPRPAPLKLVAAQRVDPLENEDDDDLPAPRAVPMRTRRVMASTTAAEMHARLEEAAPGGFAAYAAAAGAESLAQLMEAAAAYMTFLEHRDQFSRPQLMNKMREAEEHDTPREERLRIFAQLLRDGKIVKVGGGRFIGTDKIGFQP